MYIIDVMFYKYHREKNIYAFLLQCHMQERIYFYRFEVKNPFVAKNSKSIHAMTLSNKIKKMGEINGLWNYFYVTQCSKIDKIT